MKTVCFWILAGAIFLPGSLWAFLARVAMEGGARTAAPAKTLCVNPGGSGGCYSSVNEAAAAATPGDTIQVAAGIYTDTHISLPPGASLVGAGRGQTILDGQDAGGPNGVVVSAGPGSRVESLTILGGGPGYYDAGIQVSQGQVTVREVRLTGNAAGLWALCYEPAACGVQVTLEDSLVDDNEFTGVNSNDDPVFILRGNTIARNHGPAVVLNNPASLAENNLVAFNETDGLVNNIGAAVRYNDVYGNARDYVGGGPGPGGFSTDPLFRDAAGGDFRLRAASPAIGAGIPGGTDLGAEPFTPAGEPPADLSLMLASCTEWQVSVTGSGAPAGFLLYYGPASRRSTHVRDLGPAATFSLEEMSEAEGGYLAASQYDAQGRESAARIYTGPVKACPSAPAALQAGAFPGGQIRLAWQDGSTVETGIQVKRASGANPDAEFELVETVPANTQIYTDTPPALNKTYWYRLQAVNGSGSSEAGSPSYSASFAEVPNPDERYLLVLINAARAAPPAFGYASRPAVPPLAYQPLLSYAARAHSQAIVNANFSFGQIDPLGRGPTERAQAVGFSSPVSEILIEGRDGAAWVEDTLQTFLENEPERNKLLCPCYNQAGLGHAYDPLSESGQYTVDFAGLPETEVPPLPAGIVVPYHGAPGDNFTYSVNYYHPEDAAPDEAQVVIDGAPHDLQLSLGTAANGTYRFTTALPAGLHEYYFTFTFPGGQARLPETGSYPGPYLWLAYLPAVNSGR